MKILVLGVLNPYCLYYFFTICYRSWFTSYKIELISLPNTKMVIIYVPQTTDKSNVTHSALWLIVPHSPLLFPTTTVEHWLYILTSCHPTMILILIVFYFVVFGRCDCSELLDWCFSSIEQILFDSFSPGFDVLYYLFITFNWCIIYKCGFYII